MSQFFNQHHHPYHEEGQEKEDDGVAEGVAYAVIEEIYAVPQPHVNSNVGLQ